MDNLVKKNHLLANTHPHWLAVSGCIGVFFILFWLWMLRDARGFTAELPLSISEIHSLQAIERDIGTRKRWSIEFDTINATVLALPWVEHVSSSFQWNGSIALAITRTHPLVRFNHDQYLDTAGGIHPITNPETFSALINLQTNPKNIPLFLQHQRGFEEMMRKYALTPTVISISNYGSWHVWVQPNIQINLGLPPWENSFAKMQHAVAFFRKTNDKNIVRIDLRNPHGIVIALAQ